MQDWALVDHLFGYQRPCQLLVQALQVPDQAAVEDGIPYPDDGPAPEALVHPDAQAHLLAGIGLQAQAETVALAALAAQFPPGTDAEATRDPVDSAVQAAFADSPCRGIEYAGEQARLVYAGMMPESKLMPGVR